MKIRLAECFLESLMNEPIKYTSAELDLDTIDSYPIDNKLACDHNENVYIQADRDMLDYLEILQNLPSPCDESGKNGSEEKTEKLYFIMTEYSTAKRTHFIKILKIISAKAHQPRRSCGR